MAGRVNVLIANENDMVLGVGASENNVVQDLAWTGVPRPRVLRLGAVSDTTLASLGWSAVLGPGLNNGGNSWIPLTP
jgi:hypothetical protein